MAGAGGVDRAGYPCHVRILLQTAGYAGKAGGPHLLTYVPLTLSLDTPPICDFFSAASRNLCAHV